MRTIRIDPAPDRVNEEPRPVVFFDGVCGLCNRFVDWLLAWDDQQRYTLAPLQGTTARQRLEPLPLDPAGGSIALLAGGRAYHRSEAVIRIIGGLGGAWRLAHLLRAIPGPVRDWAYDLVARHRYRIFGRREQCRVPGPEERSRFLP